MTPLHLPDGTHTPTSAGGAGVQSKEVTERLESLRSSGDDQQKQKEKDEAIRRRDTSAEAEGSGGQAHAE